MADYDPKGLAVPKMDDDSPADMPTVFNNSDVTQALTSRMMVTIITMGTTLTTTPVKTSGTIPSRSEDGSSHTESTVGSRICQDLKVYS